MFGLSTWIYILFLSSSWFASAVLQSSRPYDSVLPKTFISSEDHLFINLEHIPNVDTKFAMELIRITIV